MIVIQYLLVILEALVSFLLIGLVLMQRSKSEGLGMAFGQGMGDSIFGSRAGNVLTRATIILAAVFMVNTLCLGVMFSGKKSHSLMEQYVESAPVTAPAAQAAASQDVTMDIQGGDTAVNVEAVPDDVDPAMAPVEEVVEIVEETVAEPVTPPADQ
ncbi:MAG: preprotein translocase subunit SecG [Spartobacteria bacterium]|nr:preprotein translocase subunit SecG [Spartobacteria bacterium]